MVNTKIRLIVFFADKDGEALYSQQKQDQELTVAQFRYKLEKAGKTTRPFRYDLNQFSYNYTVEVRNRFKGLDMIECLMNYRRGSSCFTGEKIKTIPMEKKCKKAKWLSEEALQIAVKIPLQIAEKFKAEEKRKDIPI